MNNNNEIINKLALRIAQLEYDKAELQVNLESLLVEHSELKKSLEIDENNK